MEDSPHNNIFLWCNPRSVSTAIEKCFAHMEGSEIWHEPYVSVYFNRLFKMPDLFTKFPKMKVYVAQFHRAAASADSVKHQYEGGNLEHSEKFSFEYIKERLEKPLDEGKTFRLIKDMALGIDGHYDKLPQGSPRHTFLIRNPNRTALSDQRMLAHLFEHNGDPQALDIGPGTHPFITWDLIQKDPLYCLWKYVRANIEPNPVVIDADDVQNHTGDVMKKYCHTVGIPWQDKYLSWDASDDYLKFTHATIEQVVWGKTEGLYKQAVKSSKIGPCSSDVPTSLPDGAERYAQEFRDGYKVMYEHRLKPDIV